MQKPAQYLPLLLAVWSSPGLAQLPCGTPARIETFAGKPTTTGALPPPDDHLVDRDPFSSDANRALSTHFALKWGTELDLSEELSEQMITMLEDAYTSEVIDWGMPDPTEIDGTYFNVYLGDTGPEVPSVEGNGGYFTLDDDGYPYIVLNHEALGHLDYMEAIVIHEFFHAVQWSSGAFSTSMDQIWYWESTATWAEGRLQPDHDFFMYWLPWYAIRPTTALNHHSSRDYDGEPPDLHQYGSFIVPWFLSEHMGGDEIVLSSWRDSDASDDPVDALDLALGEQHIEDALADMAAANLNWDYDHREVFASHMNEFAETFAHRDTRYTTAIADDDDWWVHEDSAPDCYGYHYVSLPEDALSRVQAGESLAIAVSPDVPAGLPTTLSFHARLMVESGEEWTVYTIDAEEEQTWVDAPESATSLWLAVVNTTARSGKHHTTRRTSRHPRIPVPLGRTPRR